jgi:hypothetical protein
MSAVKNRTDLALLQLQAIQEARKILDTFYQSFEQNQGVMQNGILPGSQGGYVGVGGAEALRGPELPAELSQGEPLD